MLTDDINILQYIVTLNDNLKKCPADSNNLIVLLGIFRLLLESSKQMISYDYFDENKTKIVQIVQNVLFNNMFFFSNEEKQQLREFS